MNNLNLLESLTEAATVNMTDENAVAKMGAKAKWRACIIAKPDHTLFLIQYLSNQAEILRTNAESYTSTVQPKLAAIMAAIHTKDAAQIEQAYATYQPDILDWMISNNVPLPQPEYLSTSGLQKQDELLMTASRSATSTAVADHSHNALTMVSGARQNIKKPCVCVQCKPNRPLMVAWGFARY